MSSKSGKERKVRGEVVSSERVIEALGVPSADWSRRSRKHEFGMRLVRGETELRLRALRTCGRRDSYIAFLERELVCPSGYGTGLVSEEENARIFNQATAEIEVELKSCLARQEQLERSPDAIREYLVELRRWADYLSKLDVSEPSPDSDELIASLDRDYRNDVLSDLAAHEKEIADFETKLKALENGSS